MTTDSGTQSLTFIRRGQPVTLRNVPPDRTLLEVLRDDLHLTATKEGCGEGDCGACTVVLGEAVNGQLTYKAINSCIRLAASVQGLAVWTAEDIAERNAPGARPAALSERTATQSGPRLHPVQKALVQCHASQCGFCTPGFVMSLFAMYQNTANGQGITREQAQADLSGNLCRCTGYRPILDAAQQMGRLPLPAGCAVDEAATVQALQQIPAAQGTDARFLRPTSLVELLQLRARHPQAQVVAGCTDVGLWVTKHHQRFERVLDVSAARELRQVETYPHHLAIGAGVTLTEAFDALVSERPQLQTFAQRFAGLPVRNSGTLGGNVANGSPIGDSMPLLIALGASVVLMRWQADAEASTTGGSGCGATASSGEVLHRELALEDLYTGYRTNVMRPDELLCWIKVPRPGAGAGMPSPLPSPMGRGSEAPAASATHVLPPFPLREVGGEGSHASPLIDGGALPPLPLAGEGGGEGDPAFLRVYKISKRFDDDISAVCLAIQITVHSGVVTHASIGAGGVAATPVRARQTEAALQGQPWNSATVQAAMAVLRAEFQPISDMRASAQYRQTVLGNLLQRFWLDSQGQHPVNLETLNAATLEALA